MSEAKPPAIKPAVADSQSVKWGPVAAVLITVGIFLGSQVIAGLLIVLYPIFKGWDSEQADRWLGTSTFAQFVAVLLISAVAIMLLRAYLRRRGASFKTIGLVKFKPKDLLYTLAGVGVYVPTLIAVLYLVSVLVPGLNVNQEQQIGFQAAHSGVDLAMVFISLAVLPPLLEELLTRGFLYSGLKTKLPIWQAAVITSIIFALPHLEFGTGEPLVWLAAIDTFVLSFVLIWLRERSGSLWPCIGLHFIKNSVAFLSIFIFK